MMTRLRTLTPLLPAILVLAAPARASSSYPTDIQADLSLSAPPPESCALCHTNGVTGMGTVNTPFGKTARSSTYGLGAQSPTKLAQVLTAMQSAGTDSDGDGVTDIAELKAGTDPNVAGTSTTTLPPLGYGCGAQSAPGALALWALAAWAGRRRQVRPRR
jgi:hypothetical protein